MQKLDTHASCFAGLDCRARASRDPPTPFDRLGLWSIDRWGMAVGLPGGGRRLLAWRSRRSIMCSEPQLHDCTMRHASARIDPAHACGTRSTRPSTVDQGPCDRGSSGAIDWIFDRSGRLLIRSLNQPPTGPTPSRPASSKGNHGHRRGQLPEEQGDHLHGASTLLRLWL